MAESLHGLTASSPSQVGPVRAMRARDVSVPSETDVDEAEQIEIVIVSDRRPPAPRPLPPLPPLPGPAAPPATDPASPQD